MKAMADVDLHPNRIDNLQMGYLFEHLIMRFNEEAGSGPSNIRRWIIEHDWLDAIVALPDQLFYNTGIYTYIWLVSNRKIPERKGTVQLIDGARFFRRMKKSLNNKRNEVSEDHIAALTRLYGNQTMPTSTATTYSRRKSWYVASEKSANKPRGPLVTNAPCRNSISYCAYSNCFYSST